MEFLLFIRLLTTLIAGLILGFAICFFMNDKKKENKNKPVNDDRRGCRESLKIMNQEKFSTELSTKAEFVFYKPDELIVFECYFKNKFDREQFAAYAYYCKTMPDKFYYLGEL